MKCSMTWSSLILTKVNGSSFQSLEIARYVLHIVIVILHVLYSHCFEEPTID